MADRLIGLLHPGQMGAAVGAVLRERGHRVVWASEGRSEATRARAAEAGLEDVGSVDAVAESEFVFSICPPHAALEVAARLGGFGGGYFGGAARRGTFGAVSVAANAVAPATAAKVASLVGRFVDGGIVGSPPHEAGT